MLNEYGRITLEEGEFEASWVNINEGISGDYNPDDPEDTNMLRFDFGFARAQETLCSYCTNVPASTGDAALIILLRRILTRLSETYRIFGQGEMDRAAQELSWIDGLDDLGEMPLFIGDKTLESRHVTRYRGSAENTETGSYETMFTTEISPLLCCLRAAESARYERDNGKPLDPDDIRVESRREFTYVEEWTPVKDDEDECK